MKLFSKYICKIYFLLLFPALIVFTGCNDREDDPAPASVPLSYSKIYEIMKEWYLWNEQIPNVALNSFSSHEALLDGLLFKDMDRWSYIQDEKTFDQFFNEGKFYGYGFGMKLDASQNLRVSFVYKDSPMDRVNVTRGYKITKINGKTVAELLATNSLTSAWGENKAGVVRQIEVEDLNGVKREETIVKEEVQINTVVHHEVKSLNGKKVGYLVFNSFVDTSIEELNDAFSHFSNEGISDLVLDLRYNGGGSMKVAQHLANLIGSKKAGTGKFVELAYNQQKQDSNSPYNFKAEALAVHLDRLFVVTSRSTASASEAIINGLRPYMDVFTVGDYTGGKPVGMNVWKIDGKALVPITFKVVNSRGEAEYFDGITPDAYAADGLHVDFGDASEDGLKQCLHYIQNGFFSTDIAGKRTAAPAQQIELRGFRAEVGAF